MSKKQSKRIMRAFRIDEIAGVDKAAQEGARALIMKRAPKKPSKAEKPVKTPEDEDDEELDEDDDLMETEDEGVGKRFQLLSDVDGHSHLIDDSLQGGETSYVKMTGEEYGHSHPWIRNLDGTITIGEAAGHSHEVLMGKSFTFGAPEEQTSKADNDGVDGGQSPKETEMSDTQTAANQEAATQKRLTTLEGELAFAKAFGELNDVEKAHFRTLPERDGKAFVEKSSSDRMLIMKALSDANPVVFKSEDGTEFRKNDDPRLIQFAKQADADRASAKASREALEANTLAKRATDELGNLPGEDAAKTALLKAVDGIADAAIRSKVGEILKAGNSKLAKALERAGVNGAGVTGSAVEQLEAMAKSYATENKVDLVKARNEVLKTSAGQSLYEQTLAR